MMNEPREHLCTIRLSDEEHARAERVAEHYGLNVSALFRMLIKDQARTLGIEPASAPKRRTASK
jgi:antitoxin component of RelBE/YafQ-DinJ toxin-antitoxin module